MVREKAEIETGKAKAKDQAMERAMTMKRMMRMEARQRE